jgi:hypothetical protein
MFARLGSWDRSLSWTSNAGLEMSATEGAKSSGFDAFATARGGKSGEGLVSAVSCRRLVLNCILSHAHKREDLRSSFVTLGSGPFTN